MNERPAVTGRVTRSKLARVTASGVQLSKALSFGSRASGGSKNSRTTQGTLRGGRLFPDQKLGDGRALSVHFGGSICRASSQHAGSARALAPEPGLREHLEP